MLFWLPAVLHAQKLGLTIGEADVGKEVSATLLSFNADCLNFADNYLTVQSNQSDLINTNPLSTGKYPAHLVSVTPTTVGAREASTISGATVREVPFSTQMTNFFQVNGRFVPSGSGVTIRYRVTQGTMKAVAWVAGTYTCGLTFRGGAAFCNQRPVSKTFELTVAQFLRAQLPNDLTLHINDLNYFRNTAALTGSHSLDFVTSLPYGITLYTGNSQFTYTPATGNEAATPNTPVNLVQARPLPAGTGNTINLTATYQDLLAPRQPPAGNQLKMDVRYSISAANLQKGFIAAGAYKTTLGYDIYSSDFKFPLTAQILKPTLTIQVDDMGELKVNDNEVNLAFNNQDDYSKGVAAAMPNHLKVSKTTAYDIYVRADATELTNGTNNIPVDLITLGPTTGQRGVAEVKLSATAQKIVSGALPVIDRTIGLKYAITAADAARLVGKADGTYSVTVTYSFTAP